MRNLIRGGLAAVAGLFLLASTASAKRIAIPPITDRVGKAEAIVVGKVTAFENKPIKSPTDGELAVAVVKVETGLLGAKGLTHVKVGVQAGTIEVDQGACFFLQKLDGENIYVARGFMAIMRKTDGGDYDKQIELVKRCAGMLDDPIKGLKAKSVDDRMLAAALLIGKYRPNDRPSQKTEEINAEQSKLILEALAEADWNKFDPMTRVAPLQYFYRLGITPADGWAEPANFMERNDAAKKWLKDNAGKFRIKRFVYDK